MKLTISEQLLLLALKDEKGTVVSKAGTALDFGLAGALILEMVADGRITIREGKLLVQRDTPSGDPLHDEVLSVLTGKKGKLKPVKYWVPRLASKVKKLRHKIADRLVLSGILRREKKRILGIFPSVRYPAVNPLPELEVREQVKQAVLDGISPSIETRMILNLIQACDLSDEIFGKEKRKAVKIRLKELEKEPPGDSELVGKAISEAVQAVQAAVIAGITTAVIAASASGR
ncbi:MAG: GPP34 family phosphoprotein [Acidobacteria bacterium]|nr:GPP34 family phosphoprotein [Acidobacteriota bacterium]